MRRLLTIFALLLLSATLVAAPALADPGPEEIPEAELPEAEPPTGEPRRLFSPEHRLELYEANRLSERRALLYSAALPGWGNFYAEQYALGTVALSALVFSGIFMAYGFSNRQYGLAQFGIGLAIVTYGGAAGTSYFGVRSYNDRLRRSLHVPP